MWGTVQRVAHLEAMASQVPGLFLAGNAYHGVGIPDCIHSGESGRASDVDAAQWCFPVFPCPLNAALPYSHTTNPLSKLLLAGKVGYNLRSYLTCNCHALLFPCVRRPGKCLMEMS